MFNYNVISKKDVLDPDDACPEEFQVWKGQGVL